MQIKFSGKIIGIFLAVILVIITLVVFEIKSVEKKPQTYTIITEYADKFLIKETLLEDYPEPTYNVEIYNANQKSEPELIIKLDNVEMEQKEIRPFYLSTEIKCYLIYGDIMFQEKGQTGFTTFNISDSKDLDVNEYEYLIPIAKQLFIQDWRSAQEASEFLLKSKDLEGINLIKRYVKGDFTEDELRYNMYSNYSKEDMQKDLTNLLISYNIKID